MISHDQPVAIVTGAASGIGLAIARKFVESGYRVVFSDLRSGARKNSAPKMQALSDAVIYVKADIRKEIQVRNLIRAAITKWRRLDVLCNNAGIQQLAPVDKLTAKLWDDVLAVNARAPFFATKYALPYLRKTRGSIINVASIAGLVGYAGGTVYSASKAALVMMSKIWAIELAADRIRVNCICPGATRTRMIDANRLEDISKQVPLGRVGDPEDIAELALFLVSPKAKQITGGVFVVDGGITAGRARLA